MNTFVLTTKHSYSLLLLVSLALFSYSVQSMRFDLPHDAAGRCFSEEITKINAMVLGNYSIVNSNNDRPLPPNHTITVRVSPPEGDFLYHLAERVQVGQFAFTAYQSGQYAICFMDTSDDRKVTLSIDFEWKIGVAAAKGHHKNIAKKRDVDWLVFEIQMMHETATTIKEEMSYLLERNTEMIELNWITDNRIFLLNFVSFFVCLSVAGLQVWHLKTFFEKKKII